MADCTPACTVLLVGVSAPPTKAPNKSTLVGSEKYPSYRVSAWHSTSIHNCNSTGALSNSPQPSSTSTTNPRAKRCTVPTVPSPLCWLASCSSSRRDAGVLRNNAQLRLVVEVLVVEVLVVEVLVVEVLDAWVVAVGVVLGGNSTLCCHSSQHVCTSGGHSNTPCGCMEPCVKT